MTSLLLMDMSKTVLRAAISTTKMANIHLILIQIHLILNDVYWA